MERRFQINYENVKLLKKLLDEYKLNECDFTLDALIRYAESRINDLSVKLNDPDLNHEEKDAIIRKIVIAERKFRHMLDVPTLCIKRIEQQKYSHENAMLLMIIGLLHDIGRIDEIIGQSKGNVFKNKVDHSLIGANLLVSGEKLSEEDRIYEFVTKSLIKDYWKVIRDCVKYHGALVVPEGVFSTDLEKSLINDVRLIDKSSIMNSFLYENMQTVIGIPLTELSRTSISDTTYYELTHELPVDRKKEGEEYTPNRHFMSHVGFIYDMDDYSMLEKDWIRKYLRMYSPIYLDDQYKVADIQSSAIKRMVRSR